MSIELSIAQLDELRHQLRVEAAVATARYNWEQFKKPARKSTSKSTRKSVQGQKRDPRGSNNGVKRGHYRPKPVGPRTELGGSKYYTANPHNGALCEVAAKGKQP